MTKLVATPVPMELPKNKKLLTWLRDDGASQAKHAVRAMIAEKMCEVANDKTESAMQGQPNQDEAAIEHLKEIEKCQHFIEILEKLQGLSQFNLITISHEH